MNHSVDYGHQLKLALPPIGTSNTNSPRESINFSPEKRLNQSPSQTLSPEKKPDVAYNKRMMNQSVDYKISKI
jgi:hypothetical protein